VGVALELVGERAPDLVVLDLMLPKLDGLEEAGYWTNVEATSLRELPKSIVILGAGPSGLEIAQYLARYGVRTAIVGRVNPTDHPKSSAFLADVLRTSGVDVRDTARAVRIKPKAGPGGEHEVDVERGRETRRLRIRASRSGWTFAARWIVAAT